MLIKQPFTKEVMHDTCKRNIKDIYRKKLKRLNFNKRKQPSIMYSLVHSSFLLHTEFNNFMRHVEGVRSLRLE